MSSTRSPSRPAPATEASVDPRPSLLVVGHGSARPAAPADATERHAAERHAAVLAASGRFASVAIGYLNGGPSLGAAAGAAGSGDLLVFPYLMSNERCVRKLIPEALGLNGRVTRADGRRLIYCDPLGSSPGLAEVIERTARACCVAHGLEAARTEVLLVGHGSARDPASRLMTFHNARRLAVIGSFESVACAFLEEVPLAVEVIPALAAGGPPVVVVGLFAGEGQHGGEELLRMVAERRAALAAVENPRPMYYAGPIGADPEIAGLILNLAETALRRAG